MSPDERKAYEQRVAELGKRLDRAEAGASKPASVPDEVHANQAMGLGLQMALDLVLAPVLGAAIGWGLDRAIGTRPWLLLLFLGFGIAAGITNLMRTYRQMMARSSGDIGKDLPAGRDGDDD